MRTPSTAPTTAPELGAPLIGGLPPNIHVLHWPAECADICRPERVQMLTGSLREKQD
jgi:hypothetical protein